MSVRIWVWLCLFINPMFAKAQLVKLSFRPFFGAARIQLNDSLPSVFAPENVQIETLRFYVSNMQLLKNGKVVFQEKNSFHLLDASLERSLQLSLKTDQRMDFNALKFDLGIDSLTNVSGALGGDLDPTKGMYWTWQSGYINFKLEGKSPHCKTKNNEFQFHLGGYQQPNVCLQTLVLPVFKTDEIKVRLDLKTFFDALDLSKTNHIMSPNQESVRLSTLVAKSFSIQQ